MELEETIEKTKALLNLNDILFEETGTHLYLGKQEKELIQILLNHLTKQDKMIELMAKALHLFIWKNDEKIMITSKPKVSCHTLSIEEIKQYFENKANEEAE